MYIYDLCDRAPSHKRPFSQLAAQRACGQNISLWLILLVFLRILLAFAMGPLKQKGCRSHLIKKLTWGSHYFLLVFLYILQLKNVSGEHLVGWTVLEITNRDDFNVFLPKTVTSSLN